MLLLFDRKTMSQQAKITICGPDYALLRTVFTAIITSIRDSLSGVLKKLVYNTKEMMYQTIQWDIFLRYYLNCERLE